MIDERTTAGDKRTPGELLRDRAYWTTIRVPRALRDRIAALCRDWTDRYVAGRTEDIAPSDKTGAVPPHALIDRAIRDMEGKRQRSARCRAAK